MRRSFQIADWRVEPQLNQISREGDRVRIEPRSMEVLVHLAEHPDEVLAKERIIEEVWGTFVSDEALTHAIWELRKALSDDARRPRFIQTIPKRGYRLIAPVEPADADPPAAAEPAGAGSRAPAPAPGPPRPARWPGRAAGMLAAALLLSVVAVASRWTDRAPGAGAGPRHRIVVMPFEVLGTSGHEPFAVGITEEITRRLSALESLGIVSRTMAESYAGQPLESIRRALGVEYLLRGSVYWFEVEDGLDRVRIAPELVRLGDGAQVWSAAYDRVIDDVLGVFSEITQEILGQLNVVLGLSREEEEAYRAYQRGLDLKNQPIYEHEVKENAAELFKRAVEVDSGFAAAWAELAKVQSQIYLNSDRSPSRLDQAEIALERARRLDPEAAEVRIAEAYLDFHGRGDDASALERFRELADEWPNDVEVLKGIGQVERHLGNLRKTVRYLARAARLQPGNASLAWDTARTYRALRDYHRAETYYDLAVRLAPDSRDLWGERAYNTLAATGSVAEARRLMAQYPFERDPEMLYYWLPLDLYDRQYQAAVLRFASLQGSREPIDKVHNPWYVALALQRIGQDEEAHHLIEENRLYLEQLLSEMGDHSLFLGYLGLTYGFLGRSAEATDAVRRAVELRSDGFTGPKVLEFQARVHVLLGEHEPALELLDRLLSTAYMDALTPTDLRLDPLWDPLRSSAAFQALLDSSEARGAR